MFDFSSDYDALTQQVTIPYILEDDCHELVVYLEGEVWGFGSYDSDREAYWESLGFAEAIDIGYGQYCEERRITAALEDMYQ